jgi:hypothetical protein
LLEVHVTVLLVALVGATVAVSCDVDVTLIARVDADKVTPVTAMLATVTIHVAVLDPSCVVTVMVAVPAETPVTKPEELTVAIAGLLEVQVTALLLAFAGATVAVNCDVATAIIEAVVGVTVTPVTDIVVPVPFIQAMPRPAVLIYTSPYVFSSPTTNSPLAIPPY